MKQASAVIHLARTCLDRADVNPMQLARDRLVDSLSRLLMPVYPVYLETGETDDMYVVEVRAESFSLDIGDVRTLYTALENLRIKGGLTPEEEEIYTIFHKFLEKVRRQDFEERFPAEVT